MRMPFGHQLVSKVLLVLLILGSSNAWATMEARVDRNSVGIDESFTLTLETDRSTDDEPDITGLNTDFEIQSRSQSTSVQILNGHSSRTAQWHFILMPKRAGQLRIPAINLGDEQSSHIDLMVTTVSSALTTNQTGDLFIEVNVEPHEGYVQQQMVYTVRLFRSVELGPGSSLSDPSVGSDVVVERLGDGSEYQTSRDGRRYTVIERRYALYPQKSGALTIAPILFDGSVIERSRGRNDFFRLDPFNQNTRPRRVRSAALELVIKPIPRGTVHDQWLPARSLQLVQSWSPESPKFVIGEPVTRTLALIADGLTAAQLPLLMNGTHPDAMSEIYGKQYPDQPKLTDNRDSNGITGTRQEKIAIIPIQAGRFMLPPIEIPWWNTTTNQPEVARLPAYPLEVVAGALAPPPAAPTPATMPIVPSLPVNPITTTPISIPSTNAWSWQVALILACGWAATLLAWWYQRHHHLSKSIAPTMPSTSRQAVRRLAQACRAHDQHLAKTALLSWGQAQWPEHPPTNLTALAVRVDPPCAAAIHELERALYARDAQQTSRIHPSSLARIYQPWNGEELWKAYKNQKNILNNKCLLDEEEPDGILTPLRINV